MTTHTHTNTHTHTHLFWVIHTETNTSTSAQMNVKKMVLQFRFKSCKTLFFWRIVAVSSRQWVQKQRKIFTQRVPVLKWLAWMTWPGKIPAAKAGIDPRSAALKAGGWTTRPTRLEQGIGYIFLISPVMPYQSKPPHHILQSCPEYAERLWLTCAQGADLATKLLGWAEDL